MPGNVRRDIPIKNNELRKKEGNNRKDSLPVYDVALWGKELQIIKGAMKMKTASITSFALTQLISNQLGCKAYHTDGHMKIGLLSKIIAYHYPQNLIIMGKGDTNPYKYINIRYFVL